MDLVVSRGARTRASLLWLAVTALLVALGAVAAPLAAMLPTAPGPTFAEALVQCCAAAALAAALALWGAATDVACRVLRCPARACAVGPLRRLLLTACGVTVLVTAAPGYAAPSGPDGPAVPAVPAGAAADTAVLNGLPLPDRPADGPGRSRHPADHRPDHPDRPDHRTAVVVRPGDALWSIAARAVGPGASDDEVAAYCRRLHVLNATEIGPDPDLIHPGQSLRLPPA